MSLVVRARKLHKHGAEARHYDDAFDADVNRRRFALADGAAESGFAGLWARMLVEQFVRRTECEEDDWSAWLPDVQDRWRAELEAKDLPYYGEEKFRQGSFATFLGVLLIANGTESTIVSDAHGRDAERHADNFDAAVASVLGHRLGIEDDDHERVEDDASDSDDPTFRSRPVSAADRLYAPSPPANPSDTTCAGTAAPSLSTGTWRAVAVGDSCLFHLRDGQLLHAFPLDDPASFDNAPWLLGSRMPIPEVRQPRAVCGRGQIEKGDRLWLMSDALAQWFLIECRAGRGPWLELEPLLQDSETEFEMWVGRQRTDRRMRNDDVTLVAVDV